MQIRPALPLVALGVLAVSSIAMHDPELAPPTEPCAAVEGAEAIGVHGTLESFRGGTPDPTSLIDQGIGDQTGLAGVSVTAFHYLVDIAPADTATVTITLDWDEPTQPDLRGDYDLHVFDAEGNEIAASTGDNLLGGAQAETVFLSGVEQCTQVIVHAKNWLGTPGAEATLDVGISNLQGDHVDTPCELPEGASALLAAGTGESFRGGTPDPTSVVDQGIGDQTGLAAASVNAFAYVLDVPSQYAGAQSLSITLDWDEPTQPDLRGDYDLHVFDADGNEIAASTGNNLTGGVQAETVSLSGVSDCTFFEVHAKNWLGTPGAAATLDVSPGTLTPAS
ncbi:MAG: hypothetical protein KY469_07250 [Actinobacteria bacterium]|nr:hypothetical protein [Actinomycetota bacterium]